MTAGYNVNENGLTIDQWYANANRICVKIAGLSLDDLADGPSSDAWADGVSPREYVYTILNDEGFPFDA